MKTVINKIKQKFANKSSNKVTVQEPVTTDEIDIGEAMGDSIHRLWNITRYMPEALMNEQTQVAIRQNGILTMMLYYIWGSCEVSENVVLGFRLEMGQELWTSFTTPSPSYGFLYGSESALNNFKEWEKSYLARFAPSNERELLPSLPNSYRISGTAFDHKGIYYNQNKRYLELTIQSFPTWIWIVQNCKGKVFITDRSFIFEDDQDAVLFKLQYLMNENNDVKR